MILTLADLYGLDTLVETGTLYGEMIDATIDRFSEIHSVEVHPLLAASASEKFAGFAHVRIHEGNSAVVLPALLPTITNSVLFWLDGHYSGDGTGRADADTPIVAELEAIWQRQDPADVIVIDDAREFGGNPAYPSWRELRSSIRDRFQTEPRIVNDAIIVARERAANE